MDAFKILLDYSQLKSPNTNFFRNTTSPLRYALAAGNVELVQFILERDRDALEYPCGVRRHYPVLPRALPPFHHLTRCTSFATAECSSPIGRMCWHVATRWSSFSSLPSMSVRWYPKACCMQLGTTAPKSSSSFSTHRPTSTCASSLRTRVIKRPWHCACSCMVTTRSCSKCYYREALLFVYVSVCVCV